MNTQQCIDEPLVLVLGELKPGTEPISTIDREFIQHAIKTRISLNYMRCPKTPVAAVYASMPPASRTVRLALALAAGTPHAVECARAALARINELHGFRAGRYRVHATCFVCGTAAEAAWRLGG